MQPEIRPLGPPVCVMSGATGGFGQPIAEAMARAGFRLVLLCQDLQRGSLTAEALRHAVPGVELELKMVDLASLGSVERVAAELCQEYERIDALLHVAATARPHRTLTQDGVEMTFAVNYLSPFLLTLLLRQPLDAAPHASVVFFSSASERSSRLDFGDLTLAVGYDAHDAYGRSKLADVILTYELSRRWADTAISVNCMNPGNLSSRLIARLVDGGWRPGTPPPRWRRWARGARGTLRRAPQSLRHPVASIRTSRLTTPAAAARLAVWLASDAAVAGVSGEHFNRHGPAPTSAQSRDPELARRLWDASHVLTAPFLRATATSRREIRSAG